MSLAAGTRIGPDEILSPLGTGGMGEVKPAVSGRLPIGEPSGLSVIPVCGM